MEPVRESLVHRRIADEARVELNGLIDERGQIFDEFVRKAATAKKRKWKRSGLGYGSIVKNARTMMLTGIQALHIPKICVPKNSFVESYPAEARPSEIRLDKERMADVCPAKVCSVQVCPA